MTVSSLWFFDDWVFGGAGDAGAAAPVGTLAATVVTSPGAWSALFSEPMSELVQRYTASVGFDQRLWRADIEGSLAHAEMLQAQGIIRVEYGGLRVLDLPALRSRVISKQTNLKPR